MATPQDQLPASKDGHVESTTPVILDNDPADDKGQISSTNGDGSDAHDEDERSFDESTSLSSTRSSEDQDIFWKDWLRQTLHDHQNSDSDLLLVYIISSLQPLVKDLIYEDNSASNSGNDPDSSKDQKKTDLARFMKPTNASLQKKRDKIDAHMTRIPSRAQSYVDDDNTVPSQSSKQDTLSNESITTKPVPQVHADKITIKGQNHPGSGWKTPPSKGKADEDDDPTPVPAKSKAEQLRELVAHISSSVHATSRRETRQESKEGTPSQAANNKERDNIIAIQQEVDLMTMQLEKIIKEKDAIIQQDELEFQQTLPKALVQHIESPGGRRTINSSTIKIYELELKEETIKNEGIMKVFEEKGTTFQKRRQSLEQKIMDEKLCEQKMIDEIDGLKQEVTSPDRKNQIADLEKEIEAREELLNEQASLITSLEQELDELRAAEIELRQQADEAQTRAASRISDLEDQLDQLREIHTTSVFASDEEQRTSLERNLSSATKAKELLQHKQKELMDKVEELQKKFEYASKLIKATRHSREKITRLEADNAILLQKAKDAEEILAMHEEYSSVAQQTAHLAAERFTRSIHDLEDDLSDIAHVIDSNQADTKTHWTLLEADPDSDTPFRLMTLRLTIRRLIDRYTEALDSYDPIILKYENEISVLKTKIETLAEVVHQAPQLNAEDVHKWIPLLDSERQKNAKLKKRYDDLRLKAEKMCESKPQRERENLDLRKQLKQSLNHVSKVDEELVQLREQTMQWKSEYKRLKKECGQIKHGYDEDIQAKADELQKTIKDYYNLMPKNGTSYVEQLRMKIDELNKGIQNSWKRLDTVKEERQEAFNKCKALIAENESLIEENTSLRTYMNRGSDTSVPQPEWSPYTDFAKIEARKLDMAQFREEQKRARKIEEKKARVMESVRQWQMGEHYPLRSNRKVQFRVEMKKDSWVRWGGDEWKTNVADEKDLKRLEESGLLK